MSKFLKSFEKCNELLIDTIKKSYNTENKNNA